MILVTGGGGFLGRWIVRQLLADGYGVRVYGRSEYPDLIARGVDCRQGNLRNLNVLTQAAQGCRAIIHTAAIPGIWGKYDIYYQTNFVGTQNVIAAAHAAKINTLLYTSTPSVVHGGQGIAGGDETLPYPSRFLTPYAETKALAEKLILQSNSESFATAAIRPHLIFGPGDTQLIPKLIERAREGKLRIIGKGKNRISVSYVQNVADAHVQALKRLKPGSPIAGQAYFINEPQPVNCWDFINKIVTGAGLSPITRSVPFSLAYAAGALCEVVGKITRRKEDPKLTRFLVTQLGTDHWFKIDKARRDLDWSPSVSINEGIELMLADAVPLNNDVRVWSRTRRLTRSH